MLYYYVTVLNFFHISEPCPSHVLYLYNYAACWNFAQNKGTLIAVDVFLVGSLTFGLAADINECACIFSSFHIECLKRTKSLLHVSVSNTLVFVAGTL